MFPKGVVHKQNGHRHLPPDGTQGPGDVLRLVHSDLGVAPSHEQLRFAQIVGSERLDSLVRQAAHEVDGLRASLDAAVDRTRGAFRAGELADVSQALDRLRGQVELAARIVADLESTLAAGLPSGRRPRGLIELNQVVAAVLARPGVLPDGVLLVERLERGLPRIVGDATEVADTLAEALVELTLRLGDRLRSVAVETTAQPGPVQGEGHVRLDVRFEGPVAPARIGGTVPGTSAWETGPALRQAARVVAEHGGAASVAARPGAGLTLRIEFPAA